MLVFGTTTVLASSQKWHSYILAMLAKATGLCSASSHSLSCLPQQVHFFPSLVQIALSSSLL